MEENEGAFDQDDSDDFDMELLEPYSEEEEAAEAKKTDAVTKVMKQNRQLAERQAKMEAQIERDKLVSDFYAKASDEAKEFADVLLAGVADPKKVKKMLELSEAKALKVIGTPEESAEEKEQREVENFAAPPLGNAPPEVKDVGKETSERTSKGDVQAAWWEFLAAPSQGGPEVK